MTRAEDLQAVAILVPADFSGHAADRIDRTFRRVGIERTDPALVTEEMRRTVRGIASFAGISAAMMDALPNLELIASFGV
ncbi:2-hydroxyacid dehydrogenase, partial [Mesorhizobium sp. M2D.F.Ca.ET.145.01.1.1]